MMRANFPIETDARNAACGGAASRKLPKPIPPIWRVAVGSLAAILILVGINLYAVLQLREVTTLNIELVSQRYPAIESAKWLLTNLYAQLASEKKYLAGGNPWFLMEFRDEAEEFTQTLTTLQYQESSPEGRALLGETERLYADYRGLFRTRADQRAGPSPGGAADYEKKRNVVVAQLALRLQSYVGLYETRVSDGVNDIRRRTGRVHDFTYFMIAALLLILLPLGLVGFGILRRLHQRQELIDAPGSGAADTTIEGAAAPTLREASGMAAGVTSRTWR